jgi:hypothetical protein
MRVSYVGVFWFVPADWEPRSWLAADLALSPEAPLVDGTRLPPRSHEVVWQEWAALDGRQLRRRRLPRIIRQMHFDTFPRGEVHYDVHLQRSRMLLDWRINKPEFLAAVRSHFEIDPRRCCVRTELGFVSQGRIGPPQLQSQETLD